jgi:hypothetical protein
MNKLNLGTLGLGSIGGTGFKVSTLVYDESDGRPDIIIQFQAAKQVSGERVADRNFTAGVSVYHLLGLLRRYADNQGARRLIHELPKLEALVETVKQAKADIDQETAEFKANMRG